MKKIINNPKEIVQQMVEGILYSHDDLLKGFSDTGIILRKTKNTDKVAILSGGGSGHEPADSGFVGEGMLDGCICGPIFVPPSAEDVLKAIIEVDNGLGVLLIVKNFEADVAAFLEAETKAIEQGHHVRHILVNDDCSIEKDSFKKRRRGVAGTVLVQKIVSAAAQEGMSLEELEVLGKKVIMACNTLGVALTPSSIPGKLNQQFSLADDEIFFGVGIHGEPGYRIETFHSSERLAIELVNKLKSQFEWKENESFALMVNGLGSTPLMELFVFTNDVRRLLKLEGIKVQFKKVGNFMTSNDMAGISLSLLRLEDEKWLEWLNKTVAVYGW